MKASLITIITLTSFISFILCSCDRRTSAEIKSPTTESRFKPGQAWSFQTFANETNASLVVVQTEFNSKVGRIVYIWFRGVNLPKDSEHEVLPFSEDALANSGLGLIEENSILPKEVLFIFNSIHPGFLSELEAGKADVFRTNAAEVLEIIQKKVGP